MNKSLMQNVEQNSTENIPGGESAHQVNILSRKEFSNSSTHPVEIITAETSEGHVVQLFCKYFKARERNDFGHRGGLEYEIKIYDEVLRHLPFSKPSFYGKGFFDKTSRPVLAIEYLDKAVTLSKTQEPAATLKQAARWIGGLHKYFENKAPSFVTVYDEAYYKTWVDKVQEFTQIKKDYPWIDALCFYFSKHLHLLVRHGNTFIHGEYYPLNILVKENIIYPIDWESAAIAAGEVDLASLVEDWDDEATQAAIDAYVAARWPNENKAPHHFMQVLLLAQIYFKFRWMAEYLESWLNRPNEFDALYRLAKKTNCL